MGYESKIIIVRKGHLTNEDGMRYATKLVEFDLGKVYGLSDYLTHRPATDCYYYADDHNTQIVEDRYGKPLTECSVPDLIRIVEKVIATEEASGYGAYWLYPILLATLKAFATYHDDRLMCLHFGY